MSIPSLVPLLLALYRCGAQFTSKMEGMLNDLSIGTDTSRAFGEFVRTNPEAKTSLGKMEFSVQVSGYTY
jgi:cullin 1